MNARNAYKKWGLRCCAPDEFNRWYLAALAMYVDEQEPQFYTFCRDAESSWCATQAAEGKCVRRRKRNK